MKQESVARTFICIGSKTPESNPALGFEEKMQDEEKITLVSC